MSVVFYRADSQSSALDQALALELDGLEDPERELAVLRNIRICYELEYCDTHQENTLLLDDYFFYFSVLFHLATLVNEQCQVNRVRTSTLQVIRLFSRTTLGTLTNARHRK